MLALSGLLYQSVGAFAPIVYVYLSLRPSICLKLSLSIKPFTDIQIYKSGRPIYQNERTKGLVIERNSADLMYLYESFLKCFGETAYDISIDRFQHDLFILAFNLSSNPLVAQEKMITLSSSGRSLQPIDAGIIDAEIVLKEALTENYLVFFCSVGEIFINFDRNGLAIEM